MINDEGRTMKISGINNSLYYGTASTKKNSNSKSTNIPAQNKVKNSNVTNVLCDKNYGILQTKSSKVSFKANVPQPSPLSLSKKINNLFNLLKTNDIIVAAPDYKKAVNSLKDNVESIKTVIKRVFYVEDKSLDRAIGFRKNLNNKEAINFGEKPLLLKDSKGKSSILRAGESGYLLDGDTISAGKQEIKIIQNNDIIFPIKDSYTSAHNFEAENEKMINNINMKTISLMEEKDKTLKKNKITFENVGGIDYTIKEIKKTIIFPIKHPEIKNGKNMRKSILLYGPPGTGKSLVAEACANEAGAWYKKINASQLESKWVGESEQNWRNLFEEARENQPAIIFIDEIDAIAKQRGGQDTHGDKTLNTILGLMSDSEKNGDQIYMIAATNRPNILDDAITRAGRFGHKIEVPAPDLKGTEDILKIYTKNEPISEKVDMSTVAKGLHQYKATGSEIAAAVEDARSFAMEREKIYEKIDNGTYTSKDMKNLKITQEDFNNAIEVLKNNKKPDERRPIGFRSSLYQK